MAVNWRWLRRAAVFALVCLYAPGLVFRCLWQWWPNRLTAGLMFTVFPLAVLGLWLRHPHEFLAVAAVFVGGASNGLVILANRGRMPVVGSSRADHSKDSAWQPATRRHRLLWLADRRSLLFFSVGDVVLIAGLVWLLLR